MHTPGAIYYNGFFPGFIGVLPNSAFAVHVNGMEAMLRIVRHVSPVVVTDFGNCFVSAEKDRKHFTSLKRPIDAALTNTIRASFTAVDGLEPRELFCTKEHDYVESFSIAEVISFDHIGRLRRTDAQLDQGLRRREKKGALTMGDLIQSFFPRIFARDLSRFPDLIKDLELTRKLRNATLHQGKRVEVADAERALNAVQRLIFAIEAPSWASK